MSARAFRIAGILCVLPLSLVVAANVLGQPFGFEEQRGPILEIPPSRDPDGAFRKVAAQVRYASIRIGDLALHVSNDAVSSQSLVFSAIRAQDALIAASLRMQDVDWNVEGFPVEVLSQRVPEEVRAGGGKAFQEWYNIQLSEMIIGLESWIEGRAEDPNAIFRIQTLINLLEEEGARVLGSVAPLQ